MQVVEVNKFNKREQMTVNMLHITAIKQAMNIGIPIMYPISYN